MSEEANQCFPGCAKLQRVLTDLATRSGVDLASSSPDDIGQLKYLETRAHRAVCISFGLHTLRVWGYVGTREKGKARNSPYLHIARLPSGWMPLRLQATAGWLVGDLVGATLDANGRLIVLDEKVLTDITTFAEQFAEFVASDAVANPAEATVVD